MRCGNCLLLFRRQGVSDLLRGFDERLLLLPQGVDFQLRGVRLVAGDRRQPHDDDQTDNGHEQNAGGQRPRQQPFSNRLLPWALTAGILFVSVIGLVIVVRLTTIARNQADATQLEINALRQQEQALVKTAEQVRNSLSPEQQQAVPAAHQLVDRRKFSWSRLLVDLESSLPANVRVSRIAVNDVTRQGNQTVAALDLAVFTKNPSTIDRKSTRLNSS